MSSFFKGFKKGGKNAPAAGSPTSPTALSRKLTRRRTESNTGDGFALAGGGSGDNRDDPRSGSPERPGIDRRLTTNHDHDRADEVRSLNSGSSASQPGQGSRVVLPSHSTESIRAVPEPRAPARLEQDEPRQSAPSSDRRGQSSSYSNGGGRHGDEVAGLRSEVKRLRTAQSALEKEYDELYADYKETRGKLKTKRTQFDELQDQFNRQDAKNTRRLEDREKSIEQYKTAYEKNLEFIKRQTKHMEDLEAQLRSTGRSPNRSRDGFESEADGVSEEELVSRMEALCSSMDELVSGLLDEVLQMATEDAEESEPPEEDAPPLLQEAFRAAPGSKRWGLLLDALLHQKLVDWLYGSLFSWNLGVPPGGPRGDGQLLEHLYNTVARNESWPVVQRWRSVTSKVTATLMPPEALTAERRNVLADIRDCLGTALHHIPPALDALIRDCDKKLAGLFEIAQEVYSMTTQDMVSVQAFAILGSDPAEAEARDVAMPDMGFTPDDDVAGDYSLGLVKVNEAREKTVLKRPKFIPVALLHDVE